MKKDKNNDKYKFPVEIKGKLDLPELEISDTFSENVTIKKKINSEVQEIEKIKKKKCRQSNKLI